MVDLLETTHVLAPEETAEMRAVLEQLSQETEHTPLNSEKWETIDHMRKQLTGRLTEDETSVVQANEAIAKLLEADGAALEELLSENKIDMSKVAEVLGTMNDKGALPEMPPILGAGLEELLKQGQMKLAKDPEFRRQVLSQVQSLLRDRSMDLQNVRSQLNRAFSEMPTLAGGGPGDHNAGDGNSSGNAGVGSGLAAGDAPQWGKESEDRQAKFKQVVLPPGFLDDPSNQVAGVTPGTRRPATARPSQNVSEDLPTEFSPATGREVRTRELRPRHRSVVKKYFQQENESESPPSREPSGE